MDRGSERNLILSTAKTGRNKGLAYIGTSGWNYPHWRGPFYPSDLPVARWLDFYIERFPTVEINNSFYHLPEKKTFRGWAGRAPRGFKFAVKANRYITHMKKLKDPQAPLRKLLDHAGELKARLGPILFQLPPRWKRNPERLTSFLEALPGRYRYAFEFRDQSWWDDEVLEILEAHGAAFCIFELAGVRSPKDVTADFVYIRLHGPGAAYQGQYDSSALSGWAGAFHTWRDQGLDVYCYFDNDENGYAALDAARLLDMN
jgi:uncharacterized protein YecE (DUF72 family)